MGRTWDSAGVSFDPETWRAVMRVLKPGGHMLVMGGSRTYHRMAVAVEDAGFEIRDCLQLLYGSGFPKSHNVSSSIDKLQGHENRGRAIPTASTYQASDLEQKNKLTSNPVPPYEAKTPEAEQWEGWGTALKPAHEPILLARKPLSSKTVAANVLDYRTGALNVDGCRIGTSDTYYYPNGPGGKSHHYSSDKRSSEVRPNPTGMHSEGRWPANVLLVHHEDCLVVGQAVVAGDNRTADQLGGEREGGFYSVGSDNGDNQPNAAVYGDSVQDVYECVDDCPVKILDEQSGDRPSGSGNKNVRNRDNGLTIGNGLGAGQGEGIGGDKGGASRFFYTSKPSKKEKNAGIEDGVNDHATVKPISLMRYLCRLITPPNGLVLDPFCGSGTTGAAVVLEGFNFLGIDLDAHYCDLTRQRIAYWIAHPDGKV